MKTVIKNANLVLESGILFDGMLVIENGRIAAFGPAREMVAPADAEVIDAAGAYVGPGFVDLHVHGGGGYSTYWEPEQAAQHFLRHGETSILATPDYLIERDTLIEAVQNVRRAMKSTPVIKGIYMECPYINPGYGAHANKNPWVNGVKEEDFKPIVDACGDAVKVWTIAPEREDLLPFLKYARAVNPETVFALGHSEATPMQVRALGKYKPTLMTHTMNATGRLPVGRGTRGYGPDEYCLQEPQMYAELISDSCGIHVHPELQQLIVHTKGVHRMVLVSDSTIYDGLVPEEYAHIADLNFDANGDLAGSKLTLDMACRNIMTHTNCGIAQAFLMASTNPARVAGLDEEIGSIEKGKIADLVFVDDRFNVKKVMLAGGVCKFEEV